MADSHFGHQNLVRGCSRWPDKAACRDFDTQEEHDEVLVNNINRTVGKYDILYFCGDWSMGVKDNVWKFRDRLYVKKIHFVAGNHDRYVRANLIFNTDRGYKNAQSLFTSYHEILEKKIGGVHMMLCHYPILSWHGISRGHIHLYGHTHKELNYNPSALCVSIDCHPKFQPFSLQEVIEKTKPA